MESATSSFGLIDRIKQGDREAFAPLFEKYRPRLAVLIHYRLGQNLRLKLEVDDILQETLLKAYKEFDQFSYRGPGSFLHWLSRITEHVIADQGRYFHREKRRADEIVPFRSPSNPDGVEPLDRRTPSRVFAQNEGLRQLLEKLDELPEQYRQVILLAKIEGLDTAAVAARINKSRDATALLLHRALKQLRQSRANERQK